MPGNANAWRGKNNARQWPLCAALSQFQDTTAALPRKAGIIILSEVEADDNTDEFSRYAKYDPNRRSVGR
jgi:hypothetical protein